MRSDAGAMLSGKEEEECRNEGGVDDADGDVDAADAPALRVHFVRDARANDAVDAVVGDGDEADGKIRIIGIKTTSDTASFTPAATTKMHTQSRSISSINITMRMVVHRWQGKTWMLTRTHHLLCD